MASYTPLSHFPPSRKMKLFSWRLLILFTRPFIWTMSTYLKLIDAKITTENSLASKPAPIEKLGLKICDASASRALPLWSHPDFCSAVKDVHPSLVANPCFVVVYLRSVVSYDNGLTVAIHYLPITLSNFFRPFSARCRSCHSFEGSL